MKNKLVKKILLFVIIAAVAAGGIYGGLRYRNTNMTAEVVTVESINEGYWGDEQYSSGMVTNDYSQTVELATDAVIKEVFVEEGQEVKEGDKLLELDTTEATLNYNSKVLEVENLQNQLDIANNELKILKNTTPYDPPTEVVTEPEVEEEATVQETGPEMTGNAYNYISETAVPYNQNTADGTTENPYRYLCTESAYVTGDFLQGLVADGSCAVFEIYDNNDVNGTLLVSWVADGDQLMVPESGTRWSVADRTQVVDDTGDDASDDAADDIIDDTTDDVTYYTSDELKELISEKEQEISELDLSKRKAQLEVDRLELSNTTESIIYATVDGTVKDLQDKDNLPTDGTPFLTVSGSEGLYVTGALSELLLDEVELGQTVTVSSWESGNTYEAVIKEISTYPTSNESWSDDGNSNVSYYPYTAYIEDPTGLRNGEYVDLTMTIGGDDSGDMICIDKSYVRTSDGQSYVLKADENNRLVKQYVTTGKLYYGSTIEIKAGLTLEDRVAFPYGNTAKEGIRVADADESE